MRKVLLTTALLSMLSTSAFALNAQTDTTPTLDPQFGFLTKDYAATVLNKGGKFVIVGWKQLAEGASCSVHQGQLVWKHPDQHAAKEGETVVRVARPALSADDCPMGTIFAIPSGDYTEANKAFAEKFSN